MLYKVPLLTWNSRLHKYRDPCVGRNSQCCAFLHCLLLPLLKWHSHFPRFWPWTCPAFSIKLVDNSVFYSCYYKHEDNENILPKICIFGPQIILSQRLLIAWRFKQTSTNRSYIILIGGKKLFFPHLRVIETKPFTNKPTKQRHKQKAMLSVLFCSVFWILFNLELPNTSIWLRWKSKFHSFTVNNRRGLACVLYDLLWWKS